LGTGSAIPGVYRKVTGMMVQIPHDSPPLDMPRLTVDTSMGMGTNKTCSNDFRGILLDCGEGSWQQLLKMCVQKYPQISLAVLSMGIIARISAVWVSHPHADHHLGLVQVLLQKAKLRAYLLAQQQQQQQQLQQQQQQMRMDVDIDANVVAVTESCLGSHLGSHPCSFQPIVIVAPPEVLMFLDAYVAVDPSVAGTCVHVRMCACVVSVRCMYRWMCLVCATQYSLTLTDSTN
jgi:hypothetical protein